MSATERRVTGAAEVKLPAMAVVLVTPRDYESLRETVRHLQAQTVCDCLEIIIVAPSAQNLDLDPAEFDCFLRYDLAEADVNKSISAAKMIGVHKAIAPLVVFGEDHNYPEPAWAEALIAAHHGPWAAVGPAMCNANPNSPFSWANFLISYGPWIEPAPSGVTSTLSEHNTSYKRALLLEFGSGLERMLDREGNLHRELQARGHQLYVESAARTQHLNFDRAWSTLRIRFHAGRAFGATRARLGGWSWMRRLLYVGGTPLIPLMRFRPVLREVKRIGRTRELLPRILPALTLALSAAAVGEAAGYLFGVGNTQRRLDKFEFSGAMLDRPGRVCYSRAP